MSYIAKILPVMSLTNISFDVFANDLVISMSKEVKGTP
jgi:hypothetical protein